MAARETISNEALLKGIEPHLNQDNHLHLSVTIRPFSHLNNLKRA